MDAGEGGMRAGRDDVRGEHATDRVVESHPLLGKRRRATQRDVHRLPHGDHRVLVRRRHRARLEPKRGTTRRRARGVCTTRQAEDEHIGRKAHSETTKSAARASKDEASMKSSPGRESAAGNDAPSSFLPAPLPMFRLVSSHAFPRPHLRGDAQISEGEHVPPLLAHAFFRHLRHRRVREPSLERGVSLARRGRHLPDGSPTQTPVSSRDLAEKLRSRPPRVAPKREHPSRPRLPSALRWRA